MAGRGVVWSQKESCALTEIWKDDYIKRQLSSTHKNIKVFLLFAPKMKERGYNRTTLQCRVKVKKLCQKYMSTRDKIRRSGESAEIKDSCPFYEDLDEFLGASACACPTNVVEGGSVDVENEEEQGKGIILHFFV
uniref:Myb/SANT-like DNA-binding domain-containing protein n=1 Tax=Sinocyclocheilus grahami TaxID=75366 RepID=A0A672SZD8_SINGR